MDQSGKMDAKQFGKAMNSIAYGETMMAAARDYKKEFLDKQPNQQEVKHEQVDVAELMGDADLQKLHADRIAQLQQEAEKRSKMKQQGYGTYTEITEGDFLEVVTNCEHVVCHFFHREFERCKIMDKHMQLLAHKNFHTRFIKLCAPDSPFFTVKLQIQTLPYVIAFNNGVTVHRIVGFEGLGGKDDFPTSLLEDQLLAAGVIWPAEPDEDEVEERNAVSKIRKGSAFQKTQSDEDSDFD